MVITLDSGHYGKYNQSPVIKSFYESEFNWKMTNKLAKYLKQYGITVRLTRSELNRDKALYERGLMAKGSDMFISIHSNACDDSSVDYPVVIRGFNERSTDKLAMELALAIEDIMDTRQAGRTYVRRKKTTYDEYYGVLRGARKAGVKYRFIIEHSFYTNRRACSLLMDNNMIDRLAKKEAEIIARHFKIKSDAVELPKGTHFIKVLQDNLNVRDKADWKAKPVAQVNRGEVFTVVDTVTPKNGSVKMYKLKSGVYITTHPQYVDSFYK